MRGGAPLMDPTFRLDYYLFNPLTGLSLTGGKPAASQWRIGEAPWTPSGMVVACAPIDNNSAHTIEVGTLVEDAVVNVMYGNVNGANGGLQPTGFNAPNGQSAWQWNTSGQNGSALLNAMKTCNFFYYFGHGSKNSFGIGPWDASLPNSIANIWWNDITTFWVGQTLHNWPTANFPTNSHPYRLVFIDGCESAGGGLPAAFGIPVGQFSTNFFIDAGVPCRAFVGFNDPVTINLAAIDAYEPALQLFWTSWLGNRSIHEIVTNCQAQPNYPLPSSAVIDGATDMFIGSP
jgi:hypothetical protein